MQAFKQRRFWAHGQRACNCQGSHGRSCKEMHYRVTHLRRMAPLSFAVRLLQLGKAACAAAMAAFVSRPLRFATLAISSSVEGSMTCRSTIRDNSTGKKGVGSIGAFSCHIRDTNANLSKGGPHEWTAALLNLSCPLPQRLLTATISVKRGMLAKFSCIVCAASKPRAARE